MMRATYLSTGDKILSAMKELEIGINGLARAANVSENTIMNILAGISDPDIRTVVKIADALGVEVRDLCPDEEKYAVLVEKNTLAKLIVLSEMNGYELEDMVDAILEKGIEENGFYD